MKAVIPVIASKQHGNEEFLAKLVVEAATKVMPKNPLQFNIDSVRVVKILGSNLADYKVISGMVFSWSRAGR